MFYVAQATNGTIPAGTYIAFADDLKAISGTSPAGTAIPVGGTAWYGWNSPATAYGGTGSGGSVPNGDSGYEKTTTAPESWGWGFFLDLTNADDLSNFSGGQPGVVSDVFATTAGSYTEPEIPRPRRRDRKSTWTTFTGLNTEPEPCARRSEEGRDHG